MFIENVLDDVLPDVLADLIHGDIVVVLGRDDDSVNTLWRTVLILYCYLRFSVGTEVREIFIFPAYFGQPACELVRQENRPTQSGSAALHTLSTAPNIAMVTQNLFVGDVVQVINTRPEAAPLAMPQELVYATHRRGPPAGAYLDSVL